MKISVRLWQTALFVTVVLVATLILSATLFRSLEQSVSEVSRSALKKDAKELAGSLGEYLPLTARTAPAAADRVKRFAEVFEDDVWIYSRTAELTALRVQTKGQPRDVSDVLQQARRAALERGETFAYARYSPGTNVAVASEAIRDDDGRIIGAVVVADRGAEALSIVSSARDQLRVTFLISLVVSGLLGFVFSEVIRRQIRTLSEAALAIAEGDFGQRLARARLPDEIGELADSYNRMAAKLGEAFEAITGQEREITAVVEAMAEGLVAVDARRVVRHANPVAAELLGVELGRLVGRPVDEVVKAEELLRPIDDALSGRHVSETITFGHRVLLLSATPVTSSEEPGPRGAVLLLRDVTEQKRWEQAQRQFIATASHEMRTPIAAMRGFLELLESGAKDKPEIRDDFLRTMQAEVDRLQRLVGDLFTLAQLDAGRMRLSVAPQSLEEIIGDVVAVMGPLADEAGVRLETDLAPGTPSVLCDRDRIVQVLMGFVDNALKHSRSAGEITVYARRDGSAVRVGVKDTGPGIPADVRSKIFGRFYRGGDETDGAARGAGLGLAIANEIVAAHGGAIGVDSEPGWGADFYFLLRQAP